MENTIIKEITQKGLDTYFKARQYDALYWPGLFPVKNVMALNFTTLIGEQAGRVAADIISYNSSAPLKTRQVVSKMRGDIPKIAVKRQMSETAILEYNILSRMADANEKQMLDLIWDDVDFVVQAANARLEWMALKAVSTTKLALTISNNNGIVTEADVDFQMPTANKKGAAAAWDTAGTASKPITDFKTVVKAARAVGVTLAYALMDADTFDLFVVSQEVQNYLKGFYKILSSDTLPFENLDAINTALRSARLPEIRIVDQSVGIEGKNGTITYSNPWDTNYVTFVPTLVMGNMLSGPIAEELMPPRNVVQTKAGIILVSKFSTVDPVSEFTKGEVNAFPAWKNVDVCYSLKRSATSWS